MKKSGLHSITLFEILVVVVICIGFGVFLIRPMKKARGTAVLQSLLAAGATGSENSLNMTDSPVDTVRSDVIAQLVQLKELTVDHSEFRDSDIAAITHLDLVKLSLVGTNVTDEAVPYLLSMKNLAALDLRGTFITHAGVAELLELKKLVDLRVDGSWADDSLDMLGDRPLPDQSLLRFPGEERATLVRSFTAAGRPLCFAERPAARHVQSVGATFGIHCGLIERLTCDDSRFDDECLQSMMWCRNLKTLTLTNPTLTVDGWSQIYRNRSLTSIELQGTFVDVKVATQLSRLPFLSHLSSDGFTGDALQALRCRNLMSLEIVNSSVSANAWSGIRENLRLSMITLRGLPIDAQMAEELSALKDLADLRSDGMTDDGLVALRSSALLLNLSGSPLTDAGLQGLNRERFPKLRTLYLDGCDVSDDVANEIESRIKGLYVYTTSECAAMKQAVP